MHTVAAVATTGIYCRPGCGARPHPGNVLRFSSPAAAEAAGYRSCLRCRPYRLPVSVPWTGSELVCRGVRLILAGTLDEGGEVDLAARLGVSARHLRRLFTTHLGVTPDGLARSARAHFARRLLDDTDLTITEIAYAVGFGSLRQFNRVCQDVFRSSPRQLRARRRVADRLVADGGLTMRLPFHGRLDWHAMVGYLADHAIPGVEQVCGATYRRTVVVGQNPGVIELSPGGEDHLILRAHLPHWEELVHIVDRARRIASLDLDPDLPEAHLAPDAVIGPLVRARPGLRPPGAWDPFEAGVRTIAGHRMSRPAASALVGRLVQRFGRPVDGLAQLGLHYTFPSPEALASADLAALELPAPRAAAVRAFARAVAGDVIRLDRSLCLDRLVAAITAIDGIGAWSAHTIALRLGEPDAWPITRPPAPPDQVDKWRPWRAVAATHLWQQGRLEQARVA